MPRRELPRPTRRVVLLGASNLTMGLGRVFRTLRTLWPEPLDLLMALGHGRSYGVTSYVCTRTLPGIAACGLWHDLAQRAPLPTAAIITDIGNDIVYGSDVAMIAGWVEQCLANLQGKCETRVLTELPVAAAQALGPGRYGLLRQFFFPESNVSYSAAAAAVADLNGRIEVLAAQYGAHLIQPPASWFGFDAIHFRWLKRGLAWQQFLARLAPASAPPPVFGPSWYWWAYLASRAPLHRGFLGRERGAPQPCVRLNDGTSISFY